MAENNNAEEDKLNYKDFIKDGKEENSFRLVCIYTVSIFLGPMVSGFYPEFCKHL